MTDPAPPHIASWHAHVYFGADTRDAALALRQRITERFGGRMEMGRVHERPVGPHPCWSFQVAFAPDQFADIATWLALHHGALDVFMHPNTGDALRDHRDCAVWMGRSYDLKLDVLGS